VVGASRVEPESENRLRAFVGELFANPAPLELSFNHCTRCEAYCFSHLNGREKEGLSPEATLRHITNVFRTGGNPAALADRMLLERHPIVFSNSVDPLFFQNLPSTRAVLATLQKIGVPVIFQTRGTDKPKDFPQYLDLLPDGSVLYASLVTFDEEVRRGAQRGAPRNEHTLEMMAMAAERGFPVVAALNPAVSSWMGDVGSYFERIDAIAGKGTISGAWWELLHLSKRQRAEVLRQNPPTPADLAAGKVTSLPAIVEDALAAAWARPFLHDEFFVADLVGAIEARGWRWYNNNVRAGYPWEGRADLFDLWPNPFPTHHALVAACREVSAANGGLPVAVTFDVFCSWLDQGSGVLDWEIRRKDAWYFLNQKQNVENQAAERAAIGRTISLRELLAFVWNNPGIKGRSVWGA
jgi:DNA repair photolyase